jgi:hypothetical protein
MKARDLDEIVRRVDSLPDDAIIPDPAAAIVMGISQRTLRRNCPVPKIKLGPRTGGRRLRDIRALGRGTTGPTAA